MLRLFVRLRAGGVLALAVVLLLTGRAWAADGAAAGYADFATLRLQLESIADSPDASLTSLGQTRAGRDVYLLTIGRGRVDRKPAVLLVGNVHAPSLRDSELAVRVARRLVDRAAKDKKTSELLDQFTFYVIARPSPDAAEAFFQSPLVERTANTRPVDDDNDGRADEDGPDDLNGDGRITMMRVEDTAGAYMPHPDDARVMIKADRTRGERGRYRLLVEGKDNDGDGRINEDGPGGVCFNRNYTFGYDYFGLEAGPHQVSEPETRAVADFAFEHPNIAAVVTLGPEDNLASPPKLTGPVDAKNIKTSFLPSDKPYLERLADGWRKALGRKKTPNRTKRAGALCDWAYFHYGRWSLAMPVWSIPEVDSKNKPGQEKRGTDDLRALRWLAERKLDGFVDWNPIDHPDFPGRKVEIGGFVPFVRGNPPIELIEPLVDQHVELLRQFAGQLPKLAVERIDVEPLGGGVHRVTVEVANHGYVPTASAMGEICRECHPLQIAFELPDGVSLTSGTARSRLPRIPGGGAKVTKALLFRSVSEVATTVRVRVYSPSVGEAQGQFTLPATLPSKKNQP